MLREILHNLKSKGLICIIFIGIMVCSLCLFVIKKQMMTVNEEENIQENPIVQENGEMPEEFYSFEGKWIVGEYIDDAVESTGVDINSEEYKKTHGKRSLELREKYEGYTFEINEDSIEYFYPASELGYFYNDYHELFIIYRQPDTLEIVLPFLCASVQLKELDEEFDIIIDGNGDAVLEVGNRFFELDRVN